MELKSSNPKKVNSMNKPLKNRPSQKRKNRLHKMKIFLTELKLWINSSRLNFCLHSMVQKLIQLLSWSKIKLLFTVTPLKNKRLLLDKKLSNNLTKSINLVKEDRQEKESSSNKKIINNKPNTPFRRKSIIKRKKRRSSTQEIFLDSHD